jgi:hypothetical protein
MGAKIDQSESSIVDLAFERTSRSAQLSDGAERSLHKAEHERRLEQQELRSDVGDEVVEAAGQGAQFVQFDVG